MSFIYRMNRSGPKIDPSGAQHKSFPGSENVLYIYIYIYIYLNLL